MNKLLIALALTLTVVVAQPGAKHMNKGAKHINKGTTHSNLKGANSVVKPNKIKKGDDILDINSNKLERKAKKEVIKAVL